MPLSAEFLEQVEKIPKFGRRKSKISKLANASNFLITINLNNSDYDSIAEKKRIGHVLNAAVLVLVKRFTDGNKQLVLSNKWRPIENAADRRPAAIDYNVEIGENRAAVHVHMMVQFKANVRLNLRYMRNFLDVALSGVTNGYHLDVKHGQNLDAIFRAYVDKAR